MTEQFKQEANRLILMIDAANLQATTIKGSPELRQRVKQLFEPFWNYGLRLSKHLKIIGEKTGKSEDIEVEAAFVFETLREICDAKNKIEALALLKLYNQGKILVVDDEDLPSYKPKK